MPSLLHSRVAENTQHIHVVLFFFFHSILLGKTVEFELRREIKRLQEYRTAGITNFCSKYVATLYCFRGQVSAYFLLSMLSFFRMGFQSFQENFMYFTPVNTFVWITWGRIKVMKHKERWYFILRSLPWFLIKMDSIFQALVTFVNFFTIKVY